MEEGRGKKLRLTLSQSKSSTLKICNNGFEQRIYSDTIVPVNPIAFHSSAMRFSAFRLISSERLKRARASSYVTFFISITLMYLTFDAAKLQIKSEITSKTKEKR